MSGGALLATRALLGGDRPEITRDERNDRDDSEKDEGNTNPPVPDIGCEHGREANPSRWERTKTCWRSADLSVAVEVGAEAPFDLFE